MGNLFLTLGVFEWIGDKISSGFTFIMLLIDQVVYWFASQCYQLFIKLSATRLFEDAFFSDFANRIYAILGVFMLFYLAYALLNAMVDPDRLTKGDKSVSKLATNFVISLVILGFLPSIFNYAYRLQNFILSENVIGTLVFGEQSVNSSGDNMIRYGDALSFTILNTFINPDNYNVELSTDYNWWNLKQDILEHSDYSHLPSLNKAIVYGANEITDEGVSSKTVYPEYKVILSTIVGIYVCYIMISFVLDLGVRVVKLAFCQLIAPIPVLMRAMPSKKGSFDKWLKLTLSIYFEVFVRVGMVYLSVYFINAIMSNNRLADIFFSGGIQGMLALVVVILGILTFAKQAPKMISDILGIDTGNMKLGIGEKLRASGGFVAAGMLGAGATGLVQNAASGLLGIKNNWGAAHGVLGKGKLIAGGLTGAVASAIAGTTSSMFNAFKAGKDAKSYGDVARAASTGAQKSAENRANRANYKAAHGNTFTGVMAGHVQEMGRAVEEWSGLTVGLNDLKSSQALLKNVSDSRKSVIDQLKFIRDNIEDGKRHVSFSYTDVHGNSHSYNDVELGYLRQHYEHLKTSGASAEDLRNTELMIKAAEKQANKDIANGIKIDGHTRIANASEYNGELKARINKLMTDINAANQVLSRNVENNLSDLTSAKQFTIDHKNDDVANLAMSGVSVFEDLVEKINKPSIEANANVNQEINKYIEKQEKKK